VAGYEPPADGAQRRLLIRADVLDERTARPELAPAGAITRVRRLALREVSEMAKLMESLRLLLARIRRLIVGGR